jgi:choline dehydrogenase-like flavoprotein
MTTSLPMVDVLVVGSGASAVNAAYPLVEADLQVRMLDVANRDRHYESLIPEGSFTDLRKNDPEQYRYFLGENFEGIGFEYMGAGAQLTPPRQYIERDAQRLQPIQSNTFFPLQSLAEGGLGQAWGAGSPPFSRADLDGFPISYADLLPHYESVAARIGVSGSSRDDLAPFFGELGALQPPVHIDSNGQSLLSRYSARKSKANRLGLYLGHPRLAMLSQPLRGREPTRYWDMDFWNDAGKSVYRPRWTVEELRQFKQFSFAGKRLVESFTEVGPDRVAVTVLNLETQTRETHTARALVLAAGTLGTTRIVLRSLNLREQKVPLVCNPHTYIAFLNLNTLGKNVEDTRHSMAQLSVVYAPKGSSAPFTVGHVYSYRSLLLFRLMKDSMLGARESLDILRVLSPSTGILILQHADTPSPRKYCSLTGAPGAEQLAIEYDLSAEEQARIDRVEKRIWRAFRRLRAVKLRTIRPGHAASTHFAGTFPMADSDSEKDLTTNRNGRLARTRRVYLADGSVFPNLPSKGLTFTMMANADRIGCHIRRDLAGL